MKSSPLLLALTSVLACGNLDFSGGKSCTEVGCLSFVRVDVSLPTGVTKDDVVVLVEHSGRSFTCDFGAASDPCHQGFQPDYYPGPDFVMTDNRLGVLLSDTPEQLRITVKSPQGSETQLLKPEYQRNQPNGADCPPICLSATSKLQFGS
jgi:hypothetical protein